jgi:hypothetical protein
MSFKPDKDGNMRDEKGNLQFAGICGWCGKVTNIHNMIKREG